jgi:hypothetical protein
MLAMRLTARGRLPERSSKSLSADSSSESGSSAMSKNIFLEAQEERGSSGGRNGRCHFTFPGLSAPRIVIWEPDLSDRKDIYIYALDSPARRDLEWLTRRIIIPQPDYEILVAPRVFQSYPA